MSDKQPPKQKESQELPLHEPGPWALSVGPVSNGIKSEHYYGDISGVGLSFSICAIWRDCGVEETTSEANARLIAAAPELLEACKAIVRLGEGFGQMTHVIAEAVVAVRKATSVGQPSRSADASSNPKSVEALSPTGVEEEKIS